MKGIWEDQQKHRDTERETEKEREWKKSGIKWIAWNEEQTAKKPLHVAWGNCSNKRNFQTTRRGSHTRWIYVYLKGLISNNKPDANLIMFTHEHNFQEAAAKSRSPPVTRYYMSKFVSFKYFSFSFSTFVRASAPFAHLANSFDVHFFFLSPRSHRFIFAPQWHFTWNVYYNAYDTVSMLYYVVFNFVLNARCSKHIIVFLSTSNTYSRCGWLYYLLPFTLSISSSFRWNSYSVIIFFSVALVATQHPYAINSDISVLCALFTVFPFCDWARCASLLMLLLHFLLLSASAILVSIPLYRFP